MKKIFVALATLTLLMLGMGTASAESTLPPCPTEDSNNCIWDAQVQGNGEGRSFTVIDGVVTYWDETTDTAVTDAAGWTAETCEAAGFPWSDTFCLTAQKWDGLPADQTPAQVVPETVPAEVVTASVPVPVPVEAMPAGTAERVAAGEELAYTGAGENALMTGAAASILTAGAALIYLSRRKPVVTKI